MFCKKFKCKTSSNYEVLFAVVVHGERILRENKIIESKMKKDFCKKIFCPKEKKKFIIAFGFNFLNLFCLICLISNEGPSTNIFLSYLVVT